MHTDALETKVMEMVIGALGALQLPKHDLSLKEATGSEAWSSPYDSFDGWLPLTLDTQAGAFEFSLQQLEAVRSISRILDSTNEVCKNVQYHYRNNIIGSGIQIDILPSDLGAAPTDVNINDAGVKTLKTNWSIFLAANPKFYFTLCDIVKRSKRDGEVFLRVFKQGTDAPKVRFIDPYSITGTSEAPYGIVFDKGDWETPKTYLFKNPVTQDTDPIPAESVVHYKRNVDTDTPRGIPDAYPVFTNLRRLEKLLVNTSVLTTIQSAIALVRKHENATQAQVASLINRQSDGKARTDINGKALVTRKMNPGTILDAPKGQSYDFPAHSVATENFIGVINKELAHVASNYVLPVDWLLATEQVEPLSPGSPIVANFKAEQKAYYEVIGELFWLIQEAMGIDIETYKTKYSLFISGPRLAVGKLVDEARVDEIYQRLAATSPQTIARKIGNVYQTERANVIAHRATLQPGEVAPGDMGGVTRGDGMTAANGATKTTNADGGNTNV